MTNQTNDKELEVIHGADDLPESPGRRRLLTYGAKSMPAILTLQSGAALAASSYTISPSSTYATDGLGRTLCVDESSVYPADETGLLWDLGIPPQMDVTIIPGPDEKIYYIEKNKDLPIHPGDMCLRGGTFWWKPSSGPWESSTLNKGFCASIGSVTSFALAGYVSENLL